MKPKIIPGKSQELKKLENVQGMQLMFHIHIKCVIYLKYRLYLETR